jgi:hypothetical protein
MQMGDTLPQLHQFFALRFLLEEFDLFDDFLEERYHLIIGLIHYCTFTKTQFFFLLAERVNSLNQKVHRGKLFQILYQSHDDLPSRIALQIINFFH